MSDIRTKAIVLRRTNYGEADRILNLITPEGKFAVMARGVRKEKAKLAGGIELFSVVDVVIHQNPRKKDSLGVLTSAKMLQFYGQILNDLEKLELASGFLKQIDKVSEQVQNAEFFGILAQALYGLNADFDLELVRIWFVLNFTRAKGEEINLFFDVNGEKLKPELKYNWDFGDQALKPTADGMISANEIKFLRFLSANTLLFATKIENYQEYLPKVEQVVRSVS